MVQKNLSPKWKIKLEETIKIIQKIYIQTYYQNGNLNIETEFRMDFLTTYF